MATLQFDPIKLDGIDEKKKYSEVEFMDNTSDREFKLYLK